MGTSTHRPLARGPQTSGLRRPGQSFGGHGGPAFIALAAAVTTLVAACEPDRIVQSPPDGSVVPNTNDGSASTSKIIREDFDNTDWLIDTRGVIHDINLGQLTLPTRTLPLLLAEGMVVYTGAADADGLVESNTIIVDDQAIVLAPDSVEFQAADEVEVAGLIDAGSGGVTIAARHRIVVTGDIVSKGPVRLVVTSTDGEIHIQGGIETRPLLGFVNGERPTIELLGRGSVRIEGNVSTSAPRNQAGGDIRINVYGPIVVDGGRIEASTDSEGDPGEIRMRSEQTIDIKAGNCIGIDETADPEARGGPVVLRANAITVGHHARVRAGPGDFNGGRIAITATGPIRIEKGAEIASGAGEESGAIAIHGRSIDIENDVMITGGRAQRLAGGLSLEAVETITIGRDAFVAASANECGPGGPATISVSGSLILNEGARVQAGSTIALMPQNGCDRVFPGGTIFVKAREASGIEPSIRPGIGLPVGEADVLIDPDVQVIVPDIAMGIGGFVQSRVVDRGSDALGFTPILLELIADQPEGTRVDVELAGADAVRGPFDVWNNLSSPSTNLRALSENRFVRYRIRLWGRVFDAPTVDYVEILLRD